MAGAEGIEQATELNQTIKFNPKTFHSSSAPLPPVASIKSSFKKKSPRQIYLIASIPSSAGLCSSGGFGVRIGCGGARIWHSTWYDIDGLVMQIFAKKFMEQYNPPMNIFTKLGFEFMQLNS